MALHFPSPVPHLIVPMTFVHIPKTAGTSFTRWIVDNNIHHENKNMHATAAAIRSIWEDCGFVFTFVRNPYDRLVSYFHYVGQQALNKLSAHAQGRDRKIPVNVEQETAILQIYRQGFYYWLTHECAGQGTAMNFDKTFVNWRMPQIHWSRDCNAVIKIENLPREFAWIQSYFRCQADMPHINQSDRGHYREYYTTDTKIMAARLFEEDLDTLGYVF